MKLSIIKNIVLSTGIFTSILFLVDEPKAHASTWSGYDIRTTSNITAEQINQVLETRGSTKAKNSNIGEIIVQESKKANINAGVVFGMFAVETGWGSSNLFLNNNNVGGLECIKGYACNGRWASFPTVRESFQNKIRILKTIYVGEGLVTLNQVINKYAPSDENDVEGYINMIGSVITTTQSQHVSVRKVSITKEKTAYTTKKKSEVKKKEKPIIKKMVKFKSQNQLNTDKKIKFDYMKNKTTKYTIENYLKIKPITTFK